MTERLYYQHKLYECESAVVSCTACENGYAVVLDRTVIFPESGGQLCDTGFIGEARVFDAQERGDDVVHICDKSLEVGTVVLVKVDVEPRLDYTQQHTGEHIISGIISSMFGGTNVGFHMAKDYCTVDTDIVLSKEQLDIIELEANKAVRDNVEIITKVVDADELEDYTLRKKTKGLQGEVRIVFIGNVDSCTCCGTHCEYSGEVGTIAITDSVKYKQGTRIWFSCGERAIKEAQNNSKIVVSVANRFSTSRDEAYNAVVRQGDELSALKRELKKRTDMLFEYKASELVNGAESAGNTRIIVATLDEFNMQELKMLCEKIPQDKNLATVLFSKVGENVFYQIKTGKNIKQSAKEICLVVNAMTGGKGGGRDDFAQGSCNSANNSNVRETAEQLSNYLKKSLS